jgi:type IV secretion system protein TrbJ
MKRLVIAIILSVLLAWWAPTGAVIPVVDEVAAPQRALLLVQETATALRSWVSNTNEVLQIDNQIKSLANEATNLAKLPLDLVQEVQGSLSEYNQLLQQGRGIVFSVKSSMEQFEALYSNPSMSLLERASAAVSQLRAASYTATQAQSIFDRLCAQQARLGQAMAASQGAVGALQATQATNAMLGVIAEQQASNQELLATMGRLETAYYMRQVTGEEAARANSQHYLQMQPPPDWASRPGQGIRLPD